MSHEYKDSPHPIHDVELELRIVHLVRLVLSNAIIAARVAPYPGWTPSFKQRSLSSATVSMFMLIANSLSKLTWTPTSCVVVLSLAAYFR